MNERAFDLADVLTVTTGRLLSPRHMEGVYDILNFLTGDSLFTHQLPRACDFCAPLVLEQHPDLGWITGSIVPADAADIAPWLEAMKERFGAERVLVPLEGWEHQNPIEELADMKGGAENIYVMHAEDSK